MTSSNTLLSCPSHTVKIGPYFAYEKILGQSQNGPYFGINRKNDQLRKRSEFQTLLLAGNRANNECLANVDRFNQQQIHHWLHLCANNEVTLHVHIQIAVNQQASYDLHRLSDMLVNLPGVGR